jgi:hypothetical protein
MSEIESDEYLFIRGINRQLGLEGRDRLQERLRMNLGGIMPPMQDGLVEDWAEYAERDCKNLADWR